MIPSRRWCEFLPQQSGEPAQRSWGRAYLLPGALEYDIPRDAATEIWDRPTSHYSLAEMVIGGYSSMHSHRVHANWFHVESGRVAIVSEADDRASGYAATILGGTNEHQNAVVWPGEIHAFVCLSRTARVVERYVGVGDHADETPTIRRFSPSGRVDPVGLDVSPYAILRDALAQMERDAPLVCAGLAQAFDSFVFVTRK